MLRLTYFFCSWYFSLSLGHWETSNCALHLGETEAQKSTMQSPPHLTQLGLALFALPMQGKWLPCVQGNFSNLLEDKSCCPETLSKTIKLRAGRGSAEEGTEVQTPREQLPASSCRGTLRCELQVAATGGGCSGLLGQLLIHGCLFIPSHSLVLAENASLLYRILNIMPK